MRFEEGTIKECQGEIQRWFNCGKEHENRIEQIRTRDTLSKKQATIKIYKDLESDLPSSINRLKLYRRVRKARSAYMLFNQIGEDKI
ncbi:13760_t:CDS:1, partial [Gigaspora rosea]